ncbi:hypothetical protein C0989_001253 [Termitomyces sp. Mn162]|nr:hypothetical protein C0989_001253 [Termitomyces sp. Mn162]
MLVLPALIDSGAFSTFVSSQLNLFHNTLEKLLKLQLFGRSPASTEIIQFHDNALTLRFQVWLLATQLAESTLIMLRLSWLQDINPDIDWKNLTMQFLGPKASLAANIPLSLQLPSTSNISNLDYSIRGTQTPMILKDA